MESKFNLITEPWIKVQNMDNQIELVSLENLFENAHLYKRLAGETPTQDNAILRFLMAVLYSVFMRVDIDGNYEEMESINSALNRWKDLWNLEKFPIEPIQNYLNQYYDRFYLIDEEHPFYQISRKHLIKADDKKKKKKKEEFFGTPYEASKLDGTISEGNNKTRIFSTKNGDAKNNMDYSEAARWLIYINTYDDRSGKKQTNYELGLQFDESEEPKKSLPPCWCGLLGNIEYVGENLYKTLLLNSPFLQDANKVWEPIHENDYQTSAIWELDHLPTAQLNEIPAPANPPALLTFQQRRICLHVKDDKVVGYNSIFGDYFKNENVFQEQHTIWRKGNVKDKITKKNTVVFYPKVYDFSKKIWQEFSTINVDKAVRLPGIIKWITRLVNEDIISEDENIHFKNIAIMYGSMKASIGEIYYDELSFNATILKDLKDTENQEIVWREFVENEIDRCERCAKYIGEFQKNITKELGSDETEAQKRALKSKEIFFSRMDLPVRKWLNNLNPKEHKKNYANELRSIIRENALELGTEIANQVPNERLLQIIKYQIRFEKNIIFTTIADPE